MRVVVVNHRDRPDRLAALPEEWNVWTATTPVGHTYHRVAIMAVEQRWDLDTVVVQDDVRGDFFPAERFTVYGTETSPGHICPRAFAADPATWKVLARGWAGRPRTACPVFTSVARRALVLDTIRTV